MIREAQMAFVEKRQIIDSFIIANEVANEVVSEKGLQRKREDEN